MVVMVDFHSTGFRILLASARQGAKAVIVALLDERRLRRARSAQEALLKTHCDFS